MSSIFDSFRDFFKPDVSVEHTGQTPPRTLLADNNMKFEVEQIKRGGMGIVYICRLTSELEGFGRLRVALKTFDEKFFFNVDMSMAVERETAIWSRVSDQPFILPLITTVSIEHKPYLVMPVAEPDERGIVSLADAIRQAPAGLAPNKSLQLALCLSIALAAAAERVPGLIHGDIKPDNILFLGGLPFLADFGLARLLGNSGRGGTPPYMAPELWQAGGLLSLKTDIYAFGATLFESMTGHLPFVSVKNDAEQWIQLHASAEAHFDDDDEQSTLKAGLQNLVLRCLAKSPDDRPNDFNEILDAVFALGLVTEPDITLEIMHRASYLSQFMQSQSQQIVKAKIHGFLQQGQYAAALEQLSTVPEAELDGELLLLAGSTYSLNEDDEKALVFFEKFLQTNPAPEQRMQTLNEIGLSLRRLGYLQQAKTLFEQLLEEATGQFRVSARGNYAAVLLDLNEIKESLKQLAWLTQHHPDTHVGWALYSLALDRSGESWKAVDAIRQAIQRAPRNGNYYIALAGILFRLQRPNEALAVLDKAYGLGYHTRDWLKLSIAAFLILGRTNAVNELVSSARAQLPEKVAEAVISDAIELAKQVSHEQETAAQDKDVQKHEADPVIDDDKKADVFVLEGDSALDATASEGEQQEVDEQESRPDEAMTTAQHMEAVRSGQRPHMQLRTSFVDNSFALDFYFDTESPYYAVTFKEGYNKTKWRMETMSPGMAEREANYRFAQCQKCGFVLLTARDEAERFACQACGERSPITTIRSERLDALLHECNQAIGRSSPGSSTELMTVFVAFWLDDPIQSEAIVRRMTAEGFSQTLPDAGVFSHFRYQMLERGVQVEPPLSQVWYKPIPAAEGADGRTPAFLDRIIRNLRRETGGIISASMVIPSLETVELLVSDRQGLVTLLRTQLAEHPNDSGLQQSLVSAEIRAGNLEEAKRLAAAMEIIDPNDINALKARAEVALAEHKPDEAIVRLERILDATPRDLVARIWMIKAYHEIGDSSKAAEHTAQYMALGGKMPKNPGAE